jgi:hypothetical protein
LPIDDQLSIQVKANFDGLTSANVTDDTGFRKPMLYPLSYEGLRPISYRPGDIHGCPGVPLGASRCHWAAPALVGGHAEQISGIRDAACPAVTTGAQC